MKRWFRGPWLWVILFAIVVLVVLETISSRGGYEDVKTSQMVSYINKGELKDITFVDGDQLIQGETNDGKKVQSQWLTDQGIQLLDKVQKQIDDGTIDDTYNVKVPKPSLFWSFVTGFLPVILIILFFLFMFNSMQGGGGRVMQFAKSKAKMVNKDTPKTTFADVAGATEAIEELGEIKEFLQQPAKFQAVGAKIPKGVLLYGPPEPARPCSPAPSPARRVSPSTRSPAPTSSRCSSVSVPRECATCSSRPRRTPRQSSSSTRSTPSGGTVGPAWEAGTTSASRR